MLTIHRPILTAGSLLVGGLVAALSIARPAAAHITPDPPEAPAGSTLAVGFTVEHGCGDSPTVQLDMRLPTGTTDPTPVPPDGWTGETAETDGSTIVTFAGGPLAPDVEGTFTVEMTLPRTPGVTVYFPFVQRCEVGEIRWIDIPEDGSGDELDEPAPALTLTAAVTTTPPELPTTVAPATTSAPDSTAAPTTAPETTTAPDTTATPNTTDADTTTTRPPIQTTTTLEGPDDREGGSAAGWIVGGAAAAAVVIGGGATWSVRRNRS